MGTNALPWKHVSPAGLTLVVCLLFLRQGNVVHCQADTPCDPDSEWMCATGDCIPSDYVCDGEADCDDNVSDEDISVCATWTCTEDQFECVANRETATVPICISIYFVCDDDNDCTDGSDEAVDCDEFRWRIFGIPPPTAPPTAPSCPDEQIRCDIDMRCIPEVLKCDTKYDCTDGQDEKDCDYANCTSNEFACHSKQCVAQTLLCDGKSDCKDGSDEFNDICDTPKPHCAESEFQCANGKCVLISEDLCNSKDDCGDNSDETICDQVGVNECLNSTLTACSHICKDKTFGYMCTCRPGFTLNDDGKTCTDIDECLDVVGACSQTCINVVGGYHCRCVDGYTSHDPLNKTCLHSATDPYLIFGNKYFVQRMRLDGSDIRSVSEEHEYTHVLDYDIKNQLIYYADAPNLNQAIMRMNFDGTGVEMINSVHALGIEGIAYDWISNKLYWTNNRQRGIFVSEADGTSVKVLLHDQSPLPRAISLYPQRGHLYWTDWDLEPFIASVGMDGTGMKKIITENIFWPNGLTIDYAADKLWWADAHLDNIEFSNLDGTGRNTLLQNLPHPYAITVFDDWVYWTEWNLLRVERASRLTGRNRTTLVETLHMPYDIHIVHPLRQPEGVNPCGTNNGGCSHLCLLAPMDAVNTRYTCACPESYVLQPDGKTCVHTCGEGSFLCPAPDDKCLPMKLKCDKKEDCKDGADEVDCPTSACLTGYFSCANTSQCIPYWRICDTTSNCRDGSDESADLCSAMECLSFEFRCTSGQCIPLGWVCDGDNDCADSSDEQPLNDECRACDDEDQFKCDNGNCIPLLWVCDWDDDCKDMSDEPRDVCYNKTSVTGCPAGWRRCTTNYRCVPATNFCDGNDDCRDNSDELPENCPKCPAGDFPCTEGTPSCIPERWECDFREDCEDGSDEKLDYCEDKYRSCVESREHQCRNHKCILTSKICDGVNDCQDIDGGSDEEGCGPPTCFPFEYQCTSGQCIPVDYSCDGVIHCDDASDETSCPTRFPGGLYCRPDQYQCDNNACIPARYVCDLNDDCRDGSDETRTACNSVPCSDEDSFQCTNTRRCIPKYLHCNGDDNCGDMSDETNCTVACTPQQFTCKNANCVRLLQVCDGRDDCGDKSDEIACQRNGFCTATSCDQICRNITNDQTLPAHKCECRDGYIHKPQSLTECLDVDECLAAQKNFCPQVCVNSKGAYGCECLLGFKEVASGKVCAPRAEPMLLYSVGHEIRQHDIRQRTDSDIVLAQRRVDAIDYDPDNDLMYWSDTSSKRIYRSGMPHNILELGAPQDLMIEGLQFVQDIAYDWMGGNIYMADTGQNALLVSRGNMSYIKTLLKIQTSATCTSIAVNPAMGLMFWGEMSPTGLNGAVRSANMSGRGLSIKIASGDVWEPVSLSIDYNMGGRIFWVDRRKSTIESVNFDGSDHFIIQELAFPTHMDVFGERIIWSQQSSRQLNQIDKFGRGASTQILGTNIPVSEIRLISKQKYPKVPNRCDGLVCSGLCLPEPGSARCVCPDAWDDIQGHCIQPPNLVILMNPEPCSCENGGTCVIHEAQPVCSCPPGFVGRRCGTKIGLAVTTTTTKHTTAAPKTSTMPPFSTTLMVVKDKSHQLLVAAIVAPIVIAVIILGLVALVAYWLRMRGKLGKLTSGHGEMRRGRPGMEADALRGTPHDHITAEAVAYEQGTQLQREISFDNGAVRFSNPVYDTTPGSRAVANGNQSSQAPKTTSVEQDVNTNYVYRPAETPREPPTVAEAVAGLSEIKLDLAEQRPQ